MQGSALTSLKMPDHDLPGRYLQVRGYSEQLCVPLEVEDYVIQSMPDASPAKWHLAHTSWFFETFLLIPNLPGYQPFDPNYAFLFNSYYNSVGERYARPKRGLLSRPTVEEVYRYRSYIDRHMRRLIETATEDSKWLEILRLGLNHEQQHQELILTDLKHALALNPLRPAYRNLKLPDTKPEPVRPLKWLSFA